MSGTYDGRHSKMTAADFRSYIERSISALHEAGKYGVDIRTGIRHWNP